MLPKIIHYCWFGGRPLPKLAERCIESWRRYYPGYEIRRWNESNYDVGRIPYTQKAYAAGKYAFVSDYARLDLLYRYGGMYFDTDVEAVQSFPGADMPFAGSERMNSRLMVNPGLGMGADPGMDVIGELLEVYARLDFKRGYISDSDNVIGKYATDVFSRHGFQGNGSIETVGGFRIYPPEYLCPLDYVTRRLIVTHNTCCIHHYASSWQPAWKRLSLRLWLPFAARYPQLAGKIKDYL